MLSSLCAILDEKNLRKIQAAFNPTESDGVLSGTMESYFPPSTPFIEGITSVLRPQFGSKASPLSEADQEKVIIALLASSGATTNLAIHIYIAIAHAELDISVDEVGNILMLTGIYTGINRFSSGVRVLSTTLNTLNDLAERGKKLNPAKVIPKLGKRFEPAPLPQPGLAVAVTVGESKAS